MYYFRDAWMSIFALREARMRIYVFRDSWIYTGSLFFMIREKCVYLRVICEPTTFAGIDIHFFKDFSVSKARKLHQTRCKTCPFDTLED